VTEDPGRFTVYGIGNCHFATSEGSSCHTVIRKTLPCLRNLRQLVCICRMYAVLHFCRGNSNECVVVDCRLYSSIRKSGFL
jgi:hypothetical protein